MQRKSSTTITQHSNLTRGQELAYKKLKNLYQGLGDILSTKNKYSSVKEGLSTQESFDFFKKQEKGKTLHQLLKLQFQGSGNYVKLNSQFIYYVNQNQFRRKAIRTLKNQVLLKSRNSFRDFIVFGDTAFLLRDNGKLTFDNFSQDIQETISQDVQSITKLDQRFFVAHQVKNQKGRLIFLDMIQDQQHFPLMELDCSYKPVPISPVYFSAFNKNNINIYDTEETKLIRNHKIFDQIQHVISMKLNVMVFAGKFDHVGIFDIREKMPTLLPIERRLNHLITDKSSVIGSNGISIQNLFYKNKIDFKLQNDDAFCHVLNSMYAVRKGKKWSFKQFSFD